MTGLAPVSAGDVIDVAEQEGYELGRLRLRVTKVHGILYLDSGPCTARF